MRNKLKNHSAKVHIFLEGHKILRNLHQLFVLCTASQMFGGDFAKFFGLLRIYELYKIVLTFHCMNKLFF